MSRSNTRTWGRVPIHVAVAAAAVASAGGAIAGAAVDADGAPPVEQSTATNEEPARPGKGSMGSPAQDVIAATPAGWPATDVMRTTAEAADASYREGWRLVAEHLPAGWPVTEAMLQGLDEPGA